MTDRVITTTLLCPRCDRRGKAYWQGDAMAAAGRVRRRRISDLSAGFVAVDLGPKAATRILCERCKVAVAET